MNQKADISMYGGSLLTTISSALGLTTLDMVYMVTAIIGAIIALLGYIDKRKTEKLKRKQIEQERKNDDERIELDRVRAQAVLDYLKGSTDTPAVAKSPEVIQGINRVLDEAKE
ncbi:hypothetical protein ACQV2B_19060 [Pantoea allii]|uniref:hypothetical protein n=1 Tax=Pantoea allii TaxID=574096 RepID=UPI003D31D546